MNRRGFLAALIGGTVLDPERLLWRPGAKLISIPKSLAVIPPCPFHIYPAMDGRDNVAAVMNGLMRCRWREDEAFRSQVQNAMALSDSMLIHDFARTELRNIQVGRGFYRGLVQ